MRHRWAVLVGAVCWFASAAAQITVSALGQPTYSAPVSVAPGVAGMSPQLALAYSGGGLNGPLGVGWSLDGVSAITRCPADKITDGAAASVAYLPTDRLCLDGQRLVQVDTAGRGVSSTNDAAGLSSGYREYRTAQEIDTRVRAYGISGSHSANGPAYFKAWTKAGQVYEYGEPPGLVGALVTAQGKPAVMSWPVVRISDTLGNYMDLRYRIRSVAYGSGPSVGVPTSGVEWNLSEVLYTGKTGAGARAPYNKVVLDYQDRVNDPVLPHDRVETYHAGSKNVSIARLSRIRSFVGQSLTQPVLVRTTALEYDTGPVSGRSRLIRYRECFGESSTAPGEPGSKCLPWVRFSYSNSGTLPIQRHAGFNLSNAKLLSDGNYHGVLTADFNADGRTDLFRWSGSSASSNELHYSNGDGTFSNAGLSMTDLVATQDDCFTATVLDMNADGLPDIVRFAGDQNRNGEACTITRGNNTVAVFTNSGKASFIPRVLQVDYLQKIDGPLELSRKTSKELSQYFCETTPNLAGTSVIDCPNEGQWGYGRTEGATYYWLDLNSDGRMDLVTSILPARTVQNPYDDPTPEGNPCAAMVCTQVFITNASGLLVEEATNVANQSLYSDPGAAGEYKFFQHVGDADGDGFLDLLSVGKNDSAGTWRNLGNGNFERLLGAGGDCEYALDFNGDGRQDCLYAYKGEPTRSRLSVAKGYVPGGQSFESVANFNLATVGHPLLPADNLSVGSRYGFFPLDLNGDGLTDLFRWHDDPANNRLYISLGSGDFRMEQPADYLATKFRSSDGKYTLLIGDFLGNGSPTMLRLSADASTAGSNFAHTNNLYVRRIAGIPDQLLSVTSATGVVTRIRYGNLVDDSSGRYLSDRWDSINKASYPYVDLALGSPVVVTLESDSGVGGMTIKSEYAYRGLKASVNGSGYFGLRNLRVQNLSPNGADDLTSSTEYHLERPYAGLARSSETRLGPLSIFDSASMLSRTVNRYCDTSSSTAPDLSTVGSPCSSAAKVRRPYLYESVETGVDLGGVSLPTVTTVNTVDGEGNATKIKVSTRGVFNGTAWLYEKTTDNVFDAPDKSLDNWILGRLQKATVTSKVPDLSMIPSPGSAPNASRTTGVALP